MPRLVSNLANLACSFGASPSVLTVSPGRTSAGLPAGVPLATATDFVPTTNIATFGICLSTLNPAVQAATSAASGVFTPAPCIPATSSPWTPASTHVSVDGRPAITEIATCKCQWGGVISVVNPGQQQAQSL